jgi:L-arabonate dehydrase
MGTASTMASMAEALGMACPAMPRSPASIQPPPRHGAADRPSHRADGQGRPETSDILTREAFENAIRTNAAIGGSPMR